MPATEPMKPVDRAWLRMDEPANLMVINSILFFARPMDRARLEAMLGSRLAQVRRFRQRAVRRSSKWEWEDSPGFRVGDHILEHTLPPGSGEEALRAYASAEMMRDLPRDRPLWLVHVVHGYQGGSALLFRLHHCIGDGIALVVLMLAITDLDPDADLRAGPRAWGSNNPLADLFGEARLSPQEAMRHLEQMMPEGARLLARPGEQLAKSNRWLRRAAWGPTFLKLSGRWPDQRALKGKLGGQKRVAWSRAVPLAQVRLAKEAVGLARGLAPLERQRSWRRRSAPPQVPTVSDVLIATVTGALRRYLERRGGGARLHRLSLRAVVPVSLRPLVEMSDLGNRFGLVFLSLPVGVEEPHARLSELQRRMRALKGSMEAVVVMDVLSLLGRVPQWLQDLVIRIFGTKGTAVLSSVPGPSRPLYIAGQPISGFVFWVPQSGRLGIGISLMTYDGQVRLGVASDANIVPDPEAIVAAFEEELHFLEDLKGAPAPVAAVVEAGDLGLDGRG